MPQILLCCVLALLLAALGLLLRSLHRRFRPSGGNETLKVLLVCFFICGILLHLPMYAAAYAGEHLSWMKALLGAVHHTLRMFVLDGELAPIHEFAMTQPAVWSDLYFGAAIVVYLVSPLLTFSVVLSFFKNLSAMWRYAFRRCTELYVFSELNEDSLYLAGSIKAAHPKGLIVFTDVYENESEEFGEQMAAAHRLGAACFKTDIALLRLRRSDRSRPVYFFLMGRDKAENIHQAVLLTRRWGTRSNMHLYLFATGAESELLFQSADPRGMRIRRVNEVRSLVQLLLYQQGEKLFETAAPLPEGRHQISALLLGLGQYGTEMLKALAWFGQMDGYDLRLTAVDARPNARELFTYRCPELMDRRHNGRCIPGEAQYDIRIHAGMRLESREFLELVQTLPQLTYVFVALGSDTRNIEAAVRLRELCQRRGLHPYILAVVQDPFKTVALTSVTDYRGTPYDLHFLGARDMLYSESNILHSRLEAEALTRHLKWGDEDVFWRYEFNYRSSIASVIHHRLKLRLGVPGADKPPAERTEEEKQLLRVIEHRRWNAYMRTEGYCYSGSTDPASRNDLGKLHNCLVPFDELSEKEKVKDDD